MDELSNLGGRYQLNEWLGSGGEGIVFKGYDNRLKKEVAVKRLSDIQRTEYQELANLEHPAFPRITDLICEEGCNYIVMDLVLGEDGISYIENRGVMSELQLHDTAVQLCSAMIYLHQQLNLLHGDLKPSNILISPQGEVKLIDCKLKQRLLQSNEEVKGTPGYAAPEVLSFQEVSISSDIFAFGATLYFLCTGRVPSSIPIKPTQYNKDISTSLESLMMKCLNTLPEDRYSNFNEIKESLKIEGKPINLLASDSFYFVNNAEMAIEFAYVLLKVYKLRPLIVVTQKAYASLNSINYTAEKAISLMQLINDDKGEYILDFREACIQIVKDLLLIVIPEIEESANKIKSLIKKAGISPIIWCTMWEEVPNNGTCIVSVPENSFGAKSQMEIMMQYQDFRLVTFDGILTYNEVKKVLGKDVSTQLAGAIPFSEERSKARLAGRFMLATMPDAVEKTYLMLASALGMNRIEEDDYEQAAYGNKRRRRR